MVTSTESSTHNDLLNVALEFEKCRRDFLYFVDTYCYMADNQNNKTIRFRLWDFQREIGNLMEKENRLIVLKARQLGISWVACAYALWTAIFFNNTNVLLLSHKEDLAKGLLWRIKFMMDRLPSWMVPPVVNSNLRLIEFDNKSPDPLRRFQSKIQALPATEEAGRSETATLVIGDEWAYHPYAEKNFAAIEPTFGAGGKFFGISTANGLGNFFHRTWMDAESGKNGFKPYFLSYDKHPDRKAEGWYEKKKREWVGDPKEFEQEYPRTPLEAFVATGGCIFDLEGLQYITDQLTKEAFTSQELAARNADLAALQESRPYVFRFWGVPRMGQKFIISADPAGGGASGDYCAAYIFEVVSGEMYGSIHARLEPDEFAGILTTVATIFNNAMIIPERNLHGYAVIAMLQNNYGYGNIYKHEDKQLGWPTNVKTKPLMEGILQRRIKEKDLTCYDINFVQEAQAYIRNGNKTGASDGMHDDRVIAVGVGMAVLENYEAIALPPRRRVIPKKHFKTRSLRK